MSFRKAVASSANTSPREASCVSLPSTAGKIFRGKTDTREGNIRTTEAKVGKGPPRKGGEPDGHFAQIRAVLDGHPEKTPFPVVWPNQLAERLLARSGFRSYRFLLQYANEMVDFGRKF